MCAYIHAHIYIYIYIFIIYIYYIIYIYIERERETDRQRQRHRETERWMETYWIAPMIKSLLSLLMRLTNSIFFSYTCTAIDWHYALGKHIRVSTKW